MKRAVLILLGILTIASSMAVAETEIGFSGQIAWTNHRRLDNPAGYSIFARQSLSKKIYLQFQYDYITEAATFHATIYPVFPPPPDMEPIVDDFHSKAWAHTFELALIYNLVGYKLLDLYIGGGLSATNVEADIVGIESGFQLADASTGKLGYSFLADVSLQYSYTLPLVFHIGFRGERTNSTPGPTDGYEMYDDALNFTELRFGISYRFWPYSRR